MEEKIGRTKKSDFFENQNYIWKLEIAIALIVDYMYYTIICTNFILILNFARKSNYVKNSRDLYSILTSTNNIFST